MCNLKEGFCCYVKSIFWWFIALLAFSVWGWWKSSFIQLWAAWSLCWCGCSREGIPLIAWNSADAFRLVPAFRAFNLWPVKAWVLLLILAHTIFSLNLVLSAWLFMGVIARLYSSTVTHPSWLALLQQRMCHVGILDAWCIQDSKNSQSGHYFSSQ